MAGRDGIPESGMDQCRGTGNQLFPRESFQQTSCIQLKLYESRPAVRTHLKNSTALKWQRNSYFCQNARQVGQEVSCLILTQPLHCNVSQAQGKRGREREGAGRKGVSRSRPLTDSSTNQNPPIQSSSLEQNLKQECYCTQRGHVMKARTLGCDYWEVMKPLGIRALRLCFSH